MIALAMLLFTAPAPGAPGPGSLAECYLQLAAPKANADLAYLVKSMCDDLFAPKRRALFVLDKGKACVEWWLDPHGRYENEELLCRLEPAGEQRWSLACQDKTKSSRVSLVTLQQTADDRLERVGAVAGEDLGQVFASLRECVQRKLGL